MTFLKNGDYPLATGKQMRLPAKEAEAQQALWLAYVDGDRLTEDGKRLAWNSHKKKKWVDFKDQGERTAWKLVQDWVEVQMSMIQMKQADAMQVFLPYVWNGKLTYYESMKANGFRALLPERADNGKTEPVVEPVVDAEVVA